MSDLAGTTIEVISRLNLLAHFDLGIRHTVGFVRTDWHVNLRFRDGPDTLTLEFSGEKASALAVLDALKEAMTKEHEKPKAVENQNWEGQQEHQQEGTKA